MIEIETETPSIEEFTSLKNWESSIRHLVKIFSLLLIGFFVIRYFVSLNPEEPVSLLFSTSSFLILFIMFGVYSLGLGLVYLQMRVINKTRKKSTNFGGTIGVLGLFIIGIPLLIELLLEGYIEPTVLSFMLISGISISLIGLFTEVTLIDEPLIFLLRNNFGGVIRNTVTICGLFSINLGILVIFVWPVDLIGSIGVIIGILFLWGAWFNQINQLFKSSIRTFIWFIHAYYRHIITTGTFGLIIWASLQYVIYDTGVSFDIHLILPFIIFLSSYFITLGIWAIPTKHPYFRRITTTISSYILVLGLLILVSGINVQTNDLLAALMIPSFSILLGLFIDVYLWQKEIYGILRSLFKSIHTHYREIVSTLSVGIMALGSVFGFLLGEFGTNLFGLPLVLFLVGYCISVLIWRVPTRCYHFRNITTTLSLVVVFWGLILMLSQSNHIFLEELLSRGLIFTGVGLTIIVWRFELWDVFTQTLKILKETFIKIIRFLGDFIKFYYREIVTTLSVGIMALGSVFGFLLGEFGTNLFGLPLVLFLVGYCISVLIWRVPKPHSHYRVIITTLSISLSLWGIILLLKQVNFIEEALSRGIIFIGITVNLMIWRFELWQLFSHIVTRVTNVIKYFIQIIKNFLKTYYREIVTSIGSGFMIVGSFVFMIVDRLDPFSFQAIGLFFLGYITCILIWRVPKRHAHFRDITTLFSFGISLWGLILISYAHNEFSFLISVSLIAIGLFVNIAVWRIELWNLFIQILWEIMKNIRKTIQAFIGFIGTHYREITTIISFGFMTVGSFVFGSTDADNIFNLVFIGLFILGYFLGVTIWHIPSRHEYFRGILTFFSLITLFYGFLLSLHHLSSNLFYLIISIVLMFAAIVANGTVWRTEITQIVTRTISKIKKAFKLVLGKFKQFIKDSIDVIRGSIREIVEFVVNNYREILTLVSLGLMFISLISTNPYWVILFIGGKNYLDPLAISLFLFGYFLCMLLWGFPNKHSYFRGISTSLSLIVILWGYILFASYFNDFPSLLISLGLITLGSLICVILWRNECWLVITQAVEFAVHSIKKLINSIKYYFTTYYREIFTAMALGIMSFGVISQLAHITREGLIEPNLMGVFLFLVGYIVAILLWYIPSPHDNFQVVSTILSFITISWGVLLFPITNGSSLLISFGLISIGLTVSVIVWVEELLQLLTQVVTTLLYFVRLVKRKLEILVGGMINSIFLILILAFAIPAVLYAIFVLIYAVIPPVGIFLDEFLIIYIPGIEFLARLIQGGIYEGKLIGDLEDTPFFGKFVFSMIIILLGGVLITLAAFRRENIKLNKLLNRSESQKNSSPSELKVDFSDNDGGYEK